MISHHILTKYAPKKHLSLHSLAQHSTAQTKMYNGSFASVAREFSYVGSMADTRSYSVEEQLVAFHAVTPRIPQRSQGI